MSNTDEIVDMFVHNPGITYSAQEIAKILNIDTKYIHIYLRRASKWLGDDLKIHPSNEKASNGHYVKLYTYTPDFGTSDE